MTKKKETKVEKVYLTELEREKLQELHNFNKQIDEIDLEVGRLRKEITFKENSLKEKEQQSVQMSLQAEQVSKNIGAELRKKYGNFQLGENFEIILQ